MNIGPQGRIAGEELYLPGEPVPRRRRVKRTTKHSGRNWRVGDLYGLEILDGRSFLCQVVSDHGCWDFPLAVMAITLREADLQQPLRITERDVLAVMPTFPGDIHTLRWTFMGWQSPLSFPDYAARASRRISQNWKMLKGLGEKGLPRLDCVTLHDGGLLVDFIEACLGLHPWDGMADPDYYTALLLDGVSRPATATFKSQSSEDVVRTS